MTRALGILFLSLVVTTAKSLVPRSNVLSTALDVHGQSFDFVIVGGGTSGLAFASHLSLSNRALRVLVVEAGNDTSADDTIKSHDLGGKYFNDDRYDWALNTTVQQHGNRSITVHQGKGLGGSSSINGGFYTLPPLSQLEDILQVANAAFDGPDLFESIRQTQNFVPPSDDVRSLGANANLSAHGTDGPVTIGFSSAMLRGPQERGFLQAQQDALHTPTTDDLADAEEHASGVAGFAAKTIIPESGTNRTRVSSATAFVKAPGQLSENVYILTNTRADRMLYGSGQNFSTVLTASGVELQSSIGGPKAEVNTKHVVVSAGTLGTPAFLERSGVGDDTVLQSAGITTKLHLPGVGKNLVEQQYTNVIAAQPAQPIGGDVSATSIVSVNSVDQIFTAAEIRDLRVFIESNMYLWAEDALQAGASSSLAGLLCQYKALVKGIFEKAWPVAEMEFVSSDQAFIELVWSLMSFSRGYVHASSSSAWDPPTINPRYYTAPIDLSVQAAAGASARSVFQSQALRALINGGEIVPGFNESQGGIPQEQDRKTERSRWEQFTLRSYDSVYHVMGTAAMMDELLGGVVDGKFKVHHTSNIYVVDASVIPLPLSAHPTSILYGLAFKAAALIIGT